MAPLERSSVERNLDVVLAFNEAVFNGHDVSAIDRFMAVDVLNRVTGARGRSLVPSSWPDPLR